MFDLDAQPPQYPLSRDIVLQPTSATTSNDYTWLERYIPYNGSSENYFHWFLRFK